MTDKHFNQLRNLLRHAKSLADVQEYFFDHIAEARDLMRVSQPSDEQTDLAAILRMTLKAALAIIVGVCDRFGYEVGGYSARRGRAKIDESSRRWRVHDDRSNGNGPGAHCN